MSTHGPGTPGWDPATAPAGVYKPGAPKWDRLTPEQYAVVLTAHEEGMLIHVLDGWRARQRWFETGTTLTPSDLTDDDKRALIPRFLPIVSGLKADGWIVLREHRSSAEATPLAGGDLLETLGDPASWIWDIDMNFRAIHLDTTGEWESVDRIS